MQVVVTLKWLDPGKRAIYRWNRRKNATNLTVFIIFPSVFSLIFMILQYGVDHGA